MAFNPFHSFRKHNKVVFAGLTILCMATFILSSGMGRGDFFSQMSDWFTGRGNRTVLVTIDGKNFTDQNIRELRNQRMMANEYMDAAVGAARQGLERRLYEAFAQLGDEGRFLSFLVSQRLDYLTKGRLDQLAGLQSFADQQARRADQDGKADLAKAYHTFVTLVGMDYTIHARRPGEKFFGMTDRDKIDDDVNFLIWRRQADQLGIRLADEDIDRLVADETRGELTDKAAEAISRGMRELFKGAYSAEALRAALGDEFRVRMAQVALTGTFSGSGRQTLSAPPTELTPQESWQLFKDARTSVTVGMIDVPAKDFVNKVTATPTDDELKKLFSEHKNDEPAPDRDQPGFKEPRKIQVAWIGAATDLPYYQKAAEQVLAIAPALRLLGNTQAAAALIAPLQLDAELLWQERMFRDQEPQWTNPIGQIHESSVARAEVVASLVGSTLASMGTGAPAIPAGLLAMQSRVLVQEAKDRAIVGLGFIGLAASPDPLGLFGAPVAAMPRVTLAQVRKQLMDKAKTELIVGIPPNARFDRSGLVQYGLIAADLYALRGEIMKLGREKGKADVEKYVADFVKQRGLEQGQTSEPRDKYHLGDDPGLSPLKQAYQKVVGLQDLLLHQFGPIFFQDLSQESNAPDGVFIPHKYVLTGLPDEKQIYWWRTEDIPPSAPPKWDPKSPKFEKLKAEVTEAWKRIQARDLAKKEAERILEAIKKTHGAAANLRDAAKQNGELDYFELGPFALWQPQETPSQTGGAPSRTYATLQPGSSPEAIAQLYGIPAKYIAYPDAELVEKLLDLRKNPAGETTIVTDRPKQNYYVATLLQRQEPVEDEFRRVYRGSMIGSTESDRLLAYLAGGRPEEYRKAILEQLRREANVVIHDAAKQRTSE
jgi:hypothetical protein